MKKPMIDWERIWTTMGWDIEVYNRINKGEFVSNAYAQKEIVQFLFTATVEELLELTEHLKGTENQSFKGLITHLKTIIDLEREKPSVSLPAAEGSRYNR
jgi:hypothetical protein